MNLDAYMDDFGRDLSRAARKRRSRRRSARLLLPAIPAGAALAVAITTLPSGGGGVDAIAAAREALAPDGEIVHMKIQINYKDHPASPPVEQWFAADPVRWRTRRTLPERGRGVVITMDRQGLLTGRFETAFANGRMRFYSRQRDVVTIYRGKEFRGPETGPSLFGGDPATELREQLGKGDIRDDGVVTAAGQRVRRLVREEKDPSSTMRFVYYMHPDTFAPVGGHVSVIRKGGKVLRGPEFVISGYERIPLNEQTEDLLEIEKTPRTKFVWR